MLAGFRYTSQFRWIGNSPWTSNDVEILLKTRKNPDRTVEPQRSPPRVPRLGTVAMSGESGTAILMSMASPQSGGE